MEKSSLQLAIADFVKNEFEIPRQAFDYYLEGFCGDFALALRNVLQTLGEEAHIYSLRGLTSNIAEEVWLHDVVLWKGAVWDIQGAHTVDQICEYWQETYSFQAVGFHAGSGTDEILAKEIENVERKLLALLR
jgi:hypothetical protein